MNDKKWVLSDEMKDFLSNFCPDVVMDEREDEVVLISPNNPESVYHVVKAVEAANPPRCFYVNTPVGKLKVWAKADWGTEAKEDNPEDFPGVFVDLVRDGEPDDCLACIEWDSSDEVLQTCTYLPGNDEPEAVIKQDIRKEYDVGIRVEARAYITVKAQNWEEAKKLAADDFCDFNCGDLESVDWNVINATELSTQEIHDYT